MASKFISDIVYILNPLNEIIPPAIYFALLLHPFDLAAFLVHIDASIQHDKNQPNWQFSYGTLTNYITASKEDTSVKWTRKPNYEYLQEIYDDRGFLSLYRGLTHKIIEIILLKALTKKIWKYLRGDTHQLPDEKSRWLDRIGKMTVEVILSQPWRNMMLHSFVEWDNKENNILPLAVISSIYGVNGWQGWHGYYQGLTGRWSYEALVIFCSITISELFNLPSSSSGSIKDTIVIWLRDTVATCIACPLKVMSQRMALLGVGWHWPTTAFVTCL